MEILQGVCTAFISYIRLLLFHSTDTHTHTRYLYESLGSQFLVQLVEGQFPSYDASLESNLTSGCGGCCRVPLGVKSLFLYYRDLHQCTPINKALSRLFVSLLLGFLTKQKVNHGVMGICYTQNCTYCCIQTLDCITPYTVAIYVCMLNILYFNAHFGGESVFIEFSLNAFKFLETTGLKP